MFLWIKQLEGKYDNFPKLMSEDIRLKNMCIFPIFLTFRRLFVSALSHILHHQQKLNQHFDCSMELLILHRSLRDFPLA
jgi:hypothetical protein